MKEKKEFNTLESELKRNNISGDFLEGGKGNAKESLENTRNQVNKVIDNAKKDKRSNDDVKDLNHISNEFQNKGQKFTRAEQVEQSVDKFIQKRISPSTKNGGYTEENLKSVNRYRLEEIVKDLTEEIDGSEGDTLEIRRNRQAVKRVLDTKPKPYTEGKGNTSSGKTLLWTGEEMTETSLAREVNEALYDKYSPEKIKTNVSPDSSPQSNKEAEKIKQQYEDVVAQQRKKEQQQSEDWKKEQQKIQDLKMKGLEAAARAKFVEMNSYAVDDPKREEIYHQWRAATQEVKKFDEEMKKAPKQQSDGLKEHWTEDADGNRTVHVGEGAQTPMESWIERNDESASALVSEIKKAYHEPIKKLEINQQNTPQTTKPKSINQSYRDIIAAKVTEKRQAGDHAGAQEILDQQRGIDEKDAKARGVEEKEPTSFYTEAQKEHREGDQLKTRTESLERRAEEKRAELEKIEALRLKINEKSPAASPKDQETLEKKAQTVDEIIAEEEKRIKDEAKDKEGTVVENKKAPDETKKENNISNEEKEVVDAVKEKENLPAETPEQKKENETLSEKKFRILAQRKANHESDLAQLKEKAKNAAPEDQKQIKHEILIKQEKISQLGRRTKAFEKLQFENSIENKSRLGKMGARMEKTFEKFGTWMEKPENRKRLRNRILISAAIAGGLAFTGGLGGLFGGTVMAATGSSVLTGAGAGVARSLGAFVGQGLGRKFADHNRKDYRAEMWKERESMRSYQNNLEEGSENKSRLRFQEYVTRIDGIKDKTLKTENRKKVLAGLAGGFIGGLSVRGLDAVVDHFDLFNLQPGVPDADVSGISPDTTPIEESPLPDGGTNIEESPLPGGGAVIEDLTPEQASSDAYIVKNGGVIKTFKEQINNSPKLQMQLFGEERLATDGDLTRIAKGLGYIKPDGSDVRINWGHNSAYQLWVDGNGTTQVTPFIDGVAMDGVPGTLPGEYINNDSLGGRVSAGDSERVNFSAKELYSDIDFNSDLNPAIPAESGLSSSGPTGFNGEEIVKTPIVETPAVETNPVETATRENAAAPREILRQRAGAFDIVHTDDGDTHLFSNDFKFTGDMDLKDFTGRETRLIEKGLTGGGYTDVVRFSPKLGEPLSGTSLIELKNGQFALEKMSVAGSSADAQTLAGNGMERFMKNFGMPGRVEHFTTPVAGTNGGYVAKSFTPLSDEQAKFIQRTYATLMRALPNNSN